MTLKTLADVRKLFGHIPKERRQLAAGKDSVNISVALQAERVPYRDRIGVNYYDRQKGSKSDR
jgi:hypothetical protein